MIPAETFRVLKHLNALFTNINYAIVGSTAMALQGIKLTPHDVDIVTNKTGITKMVNLLAKHKTEGITHEKESLKDAWYTSYYAKFVVGGVEIEVLADTETINKKTKERHKSDLSLKKVVSYKGMRIPVMPLEEELRVVRVLRWKPEKKKLLERFLAQAVQDTQPANDPLLQDILHPIRGTRKLTKTLLNKLKEDAWTP